MNEPEPVLVADLFAPERERLLDLLSGLSEGEWNAPTSCPGWSAKDIAQHILGDDIGVLSWKRDDFHGTFIKADSFEELVAILNERNEAWVEATRRISPPLLIELLRTTGDEITAYMKSLDPFATGVAVSWAGPEPAPVWLDVAREYTERWLHQQQVRDAVGKPGLKERRFFAPVLAAFVRALPHTYRDINARDGTHVRLDLTGDAGAAWSLVRDGDEWRLRVDVASAPDARVELDQETAWRLFVKGVSRDVAIAAATIEGDRALAGTVFDTVSILA